MSNWSKQDIRKTVSEMGNEDLLEETIRSAAGDDYDGCFTAKGSYEFEALREELRKRLVASGFLNVTILNSILEANGGHWHLREDRG